MSVIFAHQGFFTRNALTAITDIILANIAEFELEKPLTNKVYYEPPSSKDD